VRVDFLERGKPTELYFTYQLAETLHRTVEELLTGEKHPLSMAEYQNWSTYYKVKEYLSKHSKN
jgi:hypothetical protein